MARHCQRRRLWSVRMSGHKELAMLVNDDSAVREALQFALELEGMHVRAHHRGDGLLADPALAQAGCVVLDDRNREMDGFALLDQLKQRNVSIPAIMLSSHLTDRVRAQARAAGVCTVLEKPLLDNTLRDNIRAIMGSAPIPSIASSALNERDQRL